MFSALLLSVPARALAPDKIEIVQVSLDPFEDGWAVNAQFEFSLKPNLAEALEHALLPLYFDVEFELTRPRWYWLDEKTVAAHLTYRLSYQPLTHEYRVSTGTLHLNFGSLNEALGFLMRVRDWKVIDPNVIKPGETYIAALRMHFDTSQLPKPFQLNAFTSREWVLESDWKRFTFEVTR
ncbi:MAG: DUF4390 domain-containing protein [Burkholderiaceae bacterium]